MPRCPPRMMLWLMSSRAPWIASDFAETTSGNHDPSGSLMRSEPSRTCKKNSGILFAIDAAKARSCHVGVARLALRYRAEKSLGSGYFVRIRAKGENGDQLDLGL